MSTKIYNGYRIACDPFEAIPIINKAFRPIRLHHAKHMWAAFITEQFDKQTVGLEHEVVPDYWKGPCVIPDTDGNAVASDVKHRESMLAPTIVFYKHSSGSYGAQLFDVPAATYQDVWENMSFVSEYAYWNNSDRPVLLDDTQWQRRNDWWNTIFSTENGMGSPAETGFTFNPVHNDVWNASPGPAEQIPIDDREKAIGRLLAMKQVDTTEKDTAEIMEAWRDIEPLTGLDLKDVSFTEMCASIGQKGVS